jgi:hypothetical protein
VEEERLNRSQQRKQRPQSHLFPTCLRSPRN